MAKWIYTLHVDKQKQTYEGFRKPFVRTMAYPKVLALVTDQGEADLWAIDPNNVQHGLEELARFYRSNGSVGFRIAVYKDHTIHDSYGVQEKE